MVNVVFRAPLAPATTPGIVTVPVVKLIPEMAWLSTKTPLASGTPGPETAPTTCVMYTPGARFVTVTGMDVEPVDVTCVPPALLTVTVALSPMVHEEVPDVGAPKVTTGSAPVVAPLTEL